MAILKHIAIKNSNYDASIDYLTMQHDEFTMKPVLGEDGRQLPRENYIIDGILCEPEMFGRQCEATNAKFGKNQSYSEIKAHHYVISFDPRDRDENGLTLEDAQAFALEFAKKNFPGHEALVCSHPDGHNSAGNIHTHIIINSVRATDVEMQSFMERKSDAKAGCKHHLTKGFLMYLKQETMTMCQEKSLYQVNLLAPAKVKITDREYYGKLRKILFGNRVETASEAEIPEQLKEEFLTDKDYLRAAITATINDCSSYEEFKDKLFSKYGITVGESRGRINYLLPDKNKPIRGRQLGTDYEKEHIEGLFRQKSAPVKSDIRFVVDLENSIKAQQNPYYAQKVKVGNLKQMAAALAFVQDNKIASLEELDMLADAVSADYDYASSELKAVETRITKLNILIKNMGQYLSYKGIYSQYLNATNKADFKESHRAEMTLYEASRKVLRDEYGKKKLPTLKSLKEEKSELISKKNRLYEEYSDVRARHRELQVVRHNVHTALEHSPEKQQSKKRTKSL